MTLTCIECERPLPLYAYWCEAKHACCAACLPAHTAKEAATPSLVACPTPPCPNHPHVTLRCRVGTRVRALLLLATVWGLALLPSPAAAVAITSGWVSSVYFMSDNFFEFTWDGGSVGYGESVMAATLTYGAGGPGRVLETELQVGFSFASGLLEGVPFRCSRSFGTHDTTCGALHLTSGPVTVPDEWDRALVFEATVPFTAVGFLDVTAGPPIPLTGYGTMTWTDEFSTQGAESRRFARYTFAAGAVPVPEPATLWLLAAALGGLGLARRRLTL